METEFIKRFGQADAETSGSLHIGVVKRIMEDLGRQKYGFTSSQIADLLSRSSQFPSRQVSLSFNTVVLIQQSRGKACIIKIHTHNSCEREVPTEKGQDFIIYRVVS